MKIYLLPVALTGFVLTGCQDTPEEDMEELAEKYDIDVPVYLTEPGDNVEETIPAYTYEEAEQLFMYLREFNTDKAAMQEDDFEIEPELSEPVQGETVSGTHTVNLESATEATADGFSPINRHVSFAYELEEDVGELRPESVQIIEPSAFHSGHGGMSWEDSSVSVNFDEESGELSFVVMGKWVVHFLYDGKEVHFSVVDDWLVPMDGEELLQEARNYKNGSAAERSRFKDLQFFPFLG